ncbi:hypothetical protein D7S89_01405 [Trinickia fusca]|uniref:Lipoprotein n=2 Tax=Trinickia fusca TaxID=2419777 RepID=A0A494XVW4_9BURK|nr:hypothetical protein [Trinickia fusca]RKP52224.1 hypothetical protein D7S89_01405 [Trinickia fusca]
MAWSAPIAVLAAVSVLAGCAAADNGHRARVPQDPPDYRGVPTDDRPPAMLDEAPALSAPAAAASAASTTAPAH